MLGRYNFGIQSKVKVGRMKKYPFVCAWFPDDAKAIAFKEALVDLLANNGKSSISKTIRAAANEETVNPNPKDFVDVRFKARYKDPNNPDLMVLGTQNFILR